MHYPSLIAALAAMASASVLPRAKPVSETVLIQDLDLFTRVIDDLSTYSFSFQRSSVEEPIQCAYDSSDVGNDGRCPNSPGLFGTDGNVACGKATDWTFSFTDTTAGIGLQFNRTHIDGVQLIGCRFLPNKEFQCYNDPDNYLHDSESYAGPTTFNLTLTNERTKCHF